MEARCITHSFCRGGFNRVDQVQKSAGKTKRNVSFFALEINGLKADLENPLAIHQAFFSHDLNQGLWTVTKSND